MASPVPSAGRRFQEYLPSPLPAMFGSLGMQNEKVVKQAFYNTAALVFVFLSGVAAVALYYILEAFLRPLVWAALCGTFLHPFKRTCTHLLRNWLRSLREKEMPFAVGIAVLPLQTVDYSSDFLGKIVKAHYKVLLAVAIGLPFAYYLLIFQPYFQINVGIQKISTSIYALLQFFQRPILIWTTILAYLLLLFFCWHLASRVLSYFAIPVWVMLLFHIASLAGTLQTPIFLGFLGLILMGTISQVKEDRKESSRTTPIRFDFLSSMARKVLAAVSSLSPQSINATADNAQDSSPNTSADESVIKQEIIGTNLSGIDDPLATGKGNDKLGDITQKSGLPSPDEGESSKIEKETLVEGDIVDNDGLSSEQPDKGEVNSEDGPVRAKPKSPSKARQAIGSRGPKKRKGTSDPFFVALFWAFVITRVWFHLWILNIIPVLICIHLVKSLVISTGTWSYFCVQFSLFYKICEGWIAERRDAIAPAPIRGVAKLILKGDQKIIMLAETSMDKLMSVVVILCVVVFSILGAVLLAFQVHHESSHMVTVTGNVINETISTNPELFKWLPKNFTTTIQHGLDSMMHRAYLHGREWIKDQVHKFLKGQYDKNGQMERQIMEFVDRVYDALVARNSTLEKKYNMIRGNNKSLARSTSMASIFSLLSWRNVTHIISTWDFFDFNTIVGFVKENIDTLRALLESIWLILKSNLNLVISLITTVISLVFLSSTYVLNVGLSFIIFLTALFYLLSASGDQYKPVEWFSGVSMGTRFGESINNAIRDVFGAALKMATFYGFYTWVTHSVLGTNLIFIPSVLAAILAAVPFLGTYWAAIPGVLDLWLVQDEELFAILLLVLQFLPTYVVDIAIYSEISGGGHPYLTGLAVAGGIFWFGLEGAIIGPIVLCCLFAAFHVYNGIFSDTEGSTLDDGGTPRRIYSIGEHSRAGSLLFYRGIRRALSEDR